MGCKLNELGFCTSCPLRKCSHGDRCPTWKTQGRCNFAHRLGGSFSPPHVSACFQDQPKDISTQTKLTICTYNIKWDSDILQLEALLQEKKPDVICLQEVRGQRELMRLLEHLKRTKSDYAFAGRSSHGHCAVLSILPLKEVKRGWFLQIEEESSCRFQVVRDNLSLDEEFVTVMVQGILITCVHLQYRAGEEGRIGQINRVWEKLKKKEGDVVKHVIAGDFNSLTWEDKSKDEWERVAEGRRASKKDKEFEKLGIDLENNLCIKEFCKKFEESFKDFEEPKFDLTKLVKKQGFTDCWLDVKRWEGKMGGLGQRGQQATCK